jgi:hypothetical protein
MACQSRRATHEHITRHNEDNKPEDEPKNGLKQRHYDRV